MTEVFNSLLGYIHVTYRHIINQHSLIFICSDCCNYFPRYGIHDMDGSAKRIYQAALGTPADHSVIFLAHNGPTGV